MTDNVVKLHPGRANTAEHLFEMARDKKVTKVMIVGITENGDPYCNATNNCLLSELAWMQMVAHNVVSRWMSDD